MRARQLFALAIVVLATYSVVAQTPPPCRDPYGNLVPAYPDMSIPDGAMSTFRPGIGPVILYQPGIAFSPGALATFVYYHECGHHALGHVVRMAQGLPGPPSMEIDADCYSLTTLASLGWLNRRALTMIESGFYYNPARPPYYPAGPMRVAYMENCLRSRGIVLPP
jgi:hypothetical protein